MARGKGRNDGPVNAERLRGFLDCMHDEADDRDKRSAQIGAIVKAAKEAGYDTKAIRKVFVRERMDDEKRRRDDDLLETYEGVLSGKGRALRAIAEGAPVGEAARANGIHRATVARARHVANQPSNATPHDPVTGEVREDARQGEGAAAGGPHEIPQLYTSREGGRPEGLPSSPQQHASSTSGVSTKPEMGAERALASKPPPIDLEIPAHLDRRHELVRL